MPQAPAPSPLGATRRSAPTPHDDGAGAGAPGRDRTAAPTHTVVFFPPVLGGAKPRPGRGFVLDEQWAVTAEFTAGASVDMIGACGGLLCLLDVRTCAVRISNPLTGESLDLPPPPPPCTATRRDPRAYCLGFDAAARRYKVVHVPHDYKSTAATGKGVVYVHSVGEKHWRPVRSPGAAACCLAAGGAVYGGDGAAYWLTHYKAARARLVRFDLREEVATSVELPPFDGRRRPLFCRLVDADAAPCVITSARRHDPTSGESFSAANDEVDVWRLGEDGAWEPCPCGVQLRRLPRRVPGPHAVRRGRLLLQGDDGALYAHGIKERGVARIERAGEKVLVEGSSRGRGGARTLADAASPGGEGRARVRRETVVPILGIVALPLYRERLKKSDGERVGRNGGKTPVDRPARGGGRDTVRTFGYIEPTSSAPLAKYLGLGATK